MNLGSKKWRRIAAGIVLTTATGWAATASTAATPCPVHGLAPCPYSVDGVCVPSEPWGVHQRHWRPWPGTGPAPTEASREGSTLPADIPGSVTPPREFEADYIRPGTSSGQTPRGSSASPPSESPPGETTPSIPQDSGNLLDDLFETEPPTEAPPVPPMDPDDAAPAPPPGVLPDVTAPSTETPSDILPSEPAPAPGGLPSGTVPQVDPFVPPGSDLFDPPTPIEPETPSDSEPQEEIPAEEPESPLNNSFDDLFGPTTQEDRSSSFRSTLPPNVAQSETIPSSQAAQPAEQFPVSRTPRSKQATANPLRGAGVVTASSFELGQRLAAVSRPMQADATGDQGDSSVQWHQATPASHVSGPAEQSNPLRSQDLHAIPESDGYAVPQAVAEQAPGLLVPPAGSEPVGRLNPLRAE